MDGIAFLEQAFFASLTQFFEPFPSTKRFKISDDAWRMIHEYAVDHRFVYPVAAGRYEELQGIEHCVLKQLAAFCAQSGGQYVLYLADLNCIRRPSWEEDEDEDNDRDADFTVTLSSPWIKYGESRDLGFPDVTVNHLTELAPAGYVEMIEYEDVYEEEDEYAHYRDDDDPFGHEDTYSTAREHIEYALVVQPATLEHAVWAQLPIHEVASKIREFSGSPKDAIRLIRHTLSNKPYWRNTDASFIAVLQVVSKLKDAALFCDLLQSVASFMFENQFLRNAMRHFSLSKCVPTIKRMMPSLSFRSRINMICSLCVGAKQKYHNRAVWLLRRLTKLHPWSKSGAPLSNASNESVFLAGFASPTIEECTRLFALAHTTSPNSVAQLLNVPVINSITYDLLIPSFVRFVREIPDRSPLRALVSRLHKAIQSRLPLLANASYSTCRLPNHCQTCHVLQSFLTSTDQELTLHLINTAHHKHIQTAIAQYVTHAGTVSIRLDPPNIVIMKETMRTSISAKADECLALLVSLYE